MESLIREGLKKKIKWNFPVLGLNHPASPPISGKLKSNFFSKLDYFLALFEKSVVSSTLSWKP